MTHETEVGSDEVRAAARQALDRLVQPDVPRPNMVLCAKCTRWVTADAVAAISSDTPLCRACLEPSTAAEAAANPGHEARTLAVRLATAEASAVEHGFALSDAGELVPLRVNDSGGSATFAEAEASA